MKRLVEIFKNSKFTSFEEEAKTNEMINLESIPQNLIEGQILGYTGQGQVYLVRVEDKFYLVDLGAGIISFENLSEEEIDEFVEDLLDEDSGFLYEGELVDPSILS